MPARAPRPRIPNVLQASATLLALAMAAGPAHAQDKRADITLNDIETAEFSGTGELPSGQSALTVKVQILLDRSGVSPGVVDGFRGGMSESAIKAFERMHGLPMDGRLDPQVWSLLQQFATGPLTQTYTVTDQDAEGLVDAIPTDYAEKAAMESMGYTSIAEKLAERFHMDEKFLLQLNKGTAIVPGATISVTVPAQPIKGKVARIIVDKGTGRVAAYDARGTMLADYPATVGSASTPSPHGTHLVEAVALDPNYTYNPKVNFKQGENDKVLIIPPGPNAPVGNVWIDLSEPTYGIHGTPTPSRLFVSESHGCVRLTNWDARELAGMVQSGQTIVDFLAPGVTIADVTGGGGTPGDANLPAAATAAVPVAPILSGRPVARRTLPGATGVATDPLATAIPTAAAPAASVPAAATDDPLAAALEQATEGALRTQPYVLPPAPAPAPAPAR